MHGNITYAGTARKRGDRAYRDRTREEKFRWDEANRLLAVSQDGYVSHYFYDASGERTVKMHGGNSAVFVNSQMSGRETGALSFSAYFNPYFSIHDGTRFTKHLYIGSERIASMTGELDEDYYDVANNNNIVHAGVEVYVNTNDLHIPYTDRCYAMRDSIDGNYSYFGLHSGLDWSGVQLRALSLPCHGEEDGSVSNGGGSTPRSQGSGTGNEYPSRYGSIWYFHKDHLGSSTLITDGTGSISQQVEYLPYGEVFLEKQHSSDPSQPLYATPYRFNGKELDEETGLYYYGARYMNPRLSIWYATDKLQDYYYGISSYCYSLCSPNNHIDLDGNLTLFVNGYYNTRNNPLSQKVIGSLSGEKYWGTSFIDAAKKFFCDNSIMYIDGRGSFNSSGKERFNAGYNYAQKKYKYIKSLIKKGEKVNVVSHSMGSAYSEGIISYLIEKGVLIGTIVHLSPADPSDFFAHASNTLQLQINNDLVLGYKNFGENSIIKGVNRFGIVKTTDSFFDDLLNAHADTKSNPQTWVYVKALSCLEMSFLKKQTVYKPIGSPNFPNYVPVTYYYYKSINNNGIIFNEIMINGKWYLNNSSNNYRSQ